MGSYNLYPDTGINPGQQLTLLQQLNPEKEILISFLLNAIHYFLDCVFIVDLKYNYRLVVLQHRDVLFDNQYPSIEQCKMAFDEIFHEKAWSEEIEAEWSDFYDPDIDWLEEKQRRLEKR